MTTDETPSRTPASLADRAITVARLHRAIAPRAFADRHGARSSWNRRAITTSHIAAALGVGADTVLVRDDPDRHYGTGATLAPGDLIEVTNDGRRWYFIPDLSGFVMWSWLLLGPCPDCEAPRVPHRASRRPRRPRRPPRHRVRGALLRHRTLRIPRRPRPSPALPLLRERVGTPRGTLKGAPVMTTTAVETADKPARISKEDRVALAAIDVATALPGKWTVGRGRNRDQVADVVCLATGVSVGFQPVPGPGAWCYQLVPGDLPRELDDVFLWHRRDPFPVVRFAVGAPAAEVATHIHQRLIPAFHQWLDRAQTARRERLQAQTRQYKAQREIADQLESAFPQAPEPARISCLRGDRMSITLTMSVDDALARIPALAQALRADTTTPSTSTETQETT